MAIDYINPAICYCVFTFEMKIIARARYQARKLPKNNYEQYLSELCVAER